MKRILFTFGLLMVLISFSILFFQWMGFTTESAEESGAVKVNQSYSITHTGDEFIVTQTIHFLSSIPERISIEWPDHARDFLCVNDRGEDCFTKEDGEFLLSNLYDDLQEITITYTFEQPLNAEVMLVKDWHPTLSSVFTINTDIQITEKSFRTGKWITGYKSASHKKMKYIDYYSFSGGSEPSALYWTEETMLEKKSSTVRMLYDTTVIKDIGMASLSSFEGFVTVIMTNKIKPYQSPYLIVRNTAEEELLDDVKGGLLYQQYASTDEEVWLKEFIVGIILKKQPHTSNSAWAYKELIEGLTSSQLDAFKRRIEGEKTKSVDALKLDMILGAVTGFESTFFNESAKGRKNVPMVLKNDHPVFINKKSHNLSYISYKQKELIQFPQAVRALGLDIKEIQPNVFFTSINGNTFRFYVNEDYFIYNEENYGLLTKPVQTVGGSIYMDVHWFEKLFNVKVVNKGNSIEIKEEM
ncbi:MULTISPECIES: hypothetical protein [unclassified Rossellomorea]|uniref:hypothetical protein n=1 Tax=unclassified Rossellomorea TaxID=2837526 RepID=UPI00262FA1A3|nr:hypothetical protein [uncultured Rossellomorea sp.]